MKIYRHTFLLAVRFLANGTVHARLHRITKIIGDTPVVMKWPIDFPDDADRSLAGCMAIERAETYLAEYLAKYPIDGLGAYTPIAINQGNPLVFTLLLT